MFELAHLAPNSLNTLAVPSVFIIDLYIDSATQHARQDVYIVLNEDGSEHQRHTVADDAVQGDDRITLVFTGMRKGLRYSLIVDEGSEGSYYVFHNLLLDDLLDTDANPDSTVDAAGDQPEPDKYDSMALEDQLPDIPDDLRGHQPSGWEIADLPPTEGAGESIV